MKIEIQDGKFGNSPPSEFVVKSYEELEKIANHYNAPIHVIQKYKATGGTDIYWCFTPFALYKWIDSRKRTVTKEDMQTAELYEPITESQLTSPT